MPMFNAERHIARCLAPLLAMLQAGEIDELIVVSDCATDRSEELVRPHSEVRLLRTKRQGGPGAARNLGVAAATRDYVWFVDSDVVLAGDAARVLRTVLAKEACGAVIGSYDDRPDAPNFLSQYKNLVHHYYHHRGHRRASTFWAGCGAVRRQLFVDIGGFDADAYPYPSIEDIELGYRIVAAGEQITLESRLQGKHLKEWRLVNLLHTEIFRRAIPWSRLMLSRNVVTSDLNVSQGELIRAVLAGLTGASLLAAIPGLVPIWISLVVLGGTAVANREILTFFKWKRGAWFALRAFLFHQLYYVYSSASYAFASLDYELRSTIRIAQKPPDEVNPGPPDRSNQ